MRSARGPAVPKQSIQALGSHLRKDEVDQALVDGLIDVRDYARYLVGSVLAGLFGTWPEDIPDAADPVPAHTAFDGAYPNPFNPSTTLRFALATPEHARLDVYDLAGRRLRTLVDADLPAAEHEAVWDGRDDRGSVLPSGVYFARLTAGGFRSSQKLMLLK